MDSCCFTGYRPEKFPFELKFGTPDFNRLENKIYDAVFAENKDGAKVFYCGMACGFDLLCGKAVVDLKRLNPDGDVKLIAAIPFKGQSERYSDLWKKLYDLVLSECDETVYIKQNYTQDCFSLRNRYMVDNSARVITYFDGQSGGTANTLRYAANKDRKIINVADYDLEELFGEFRSYQIIF